MPRLKINLAELDRQFFNGMDTYTRVLNPTVGALCTDKLARVRRHVFDFPAKFSQCYYARRANRGEWMFLLGLFWTRNYLMVKSWDFANQPLLIDRAAVAADRRLGQALGNLHWRGIYGPFDDVVHMYSTTSPVLELIEQESDNASVSF